MKKIIFALGLIIGWLFSLFVPPPDWMETHIQNLFYAGHTRIERGVNETKKTVSEHLRESAEQPMKQVEKQLKDQ